MGRVSVPLRLAVLSDQLPVIALVGRYPANKLIGSRPLQKRLAALPRRDYAVLALLSKGYPSLLGRYQLIPRPFAAFNLRIATEKYRSTCMF